MLDYITIMILHPSLLKDSTKSPRNLKNLEILVKATQIYIPLLFNMTLSISFSNFVTEVPFYLVFESPANFYSSLISIGSKFFPLFLKLLFLPFSSNLGVTLTLKNLLYIQKYILRSYFVIIFNSTLI